MHISRKGNFATKANKFVFSYFRSITRILFLHYVQQLYWHNLDERPRCYCKGCSREVQIYMRHIHWPRKGPDWVCSCQKWINFALKVTHWSRIVERHCIWITTNISWDRLSSQLNRTSFNLYNRQNPQHLFQQACIELNEIRFAATSILPQGSARAARVMTSHMKWTERITRAEEMVKVTE